MVSGSAKGFDAMAGHLIEAMIWCLLPCENTYQPRQYEPHHVARKTWKAATSNVGRGVEMVKRDVHVFVRL